MCPRAIPCSILPAKTQLLDDYGVSEVCDQDEQTKLTAQKQNATSILSPRNSKKLQFSPQIT